MRNRAIMVLALLLVPAAVSAQGMRRGGRMGGPGPGAMNPAQTLIKHRADLDLSDEQVTTLEGFAKQITASHEAMRAAMDSLHESGDMRAMTDEQREQMRALREAMMASNRTLQEGIRSTLTAEQLEQAAKFLPPPGRGRGGERMGGRAGRRGGSGPAALRVTPRAGAARRIGPRAGGFRRVVLVRPVRVLRPASRPLGVRRVIRSSD
jgi:Skp family chaperone for outer membrane proteins